MYKEMSMYQQKIISVYKTRIFLAQTEMRD